MRYESYIIIYIYDGSIYMYYTGVGTTTKTFSTIFTPRCINQKI